MAARVVVSDRLPVPAGPFQVGCSAAAARCGQDQGQPGRVRGQVPACRIDGHAVAVRAHRNVKPAGQGDAIYGLSLGFRCAADPP